MARGRADDTTGSRFFQANPGQGLLNNLLALLCPQRHRRVHIQLDFGHVETRGLNLGHGRANRLF
jgi:hypothetical protein